MASEQNEGEKPFKVQDRRRFSASGEARQDAEAADTTAGQAASATEPTMPPGEHPPLTFDAFFMGLSTQALALLGEIPDPVQGRTVVDLDGARQIIDILGMLRDKTRGNLDDREAALLDGALYQLRMKYVDRANGR